MFVLGKYERDKARVIGSLEKRNLVMQTE